MTYPPLKAFHTINLLFIKSNITLTAPDYTFLHIPFPVNNRKHNGNLPLIMFRIVKYVPDLI
jgi:hypothetical protein